MITGKMMVTFGAFLLLTTGSQMGSAVSDQTVPNGQMKHERVIGGAGWAGPTEKGKGTEKGGGKAGERGGVTKRPCHAHEGQKKKKCVKVYKENQRRAKMKWPPRPTVKEIQARVGMSNWRKAERVAYCETAGNWNHYPHGSYIGGLGMYRRTYGYGQRVTGYRWVSEGATKQEQIAIAVASHPITGGWSGWGCGGA